eukprot:scaffold613_cov79-Phaeocystis_antarctica.AAC.2
MMWVLLLSCLFAQVAAHGHLLTPAPRQCKEGGCGGAGYIDDEPRSTPTVTSRRARDAAAAAAAAS